MSTTHHVILTEQNVWFFALKNIKYYQLFFSIHGATHFGVSTFEKKKKKICRGERSSLM